MVFSGLTSKPVATVFFSLASNPVVTVSPGLALKPVVSFLVKPQNRGGGGFSGLSLKTDSYGLVICASKSPRGFLGLGLKTKQASVFWFASKPTGGCDGLRHASRSSGLLHVKVSLTRVFQFASKLVEARRWVCMWQHRRGCIEDKLKTDGSM
jgi:hypothetical protein